MALQSEISSLERERERDGTNKYSCPVLEGV